MLSFVEGLHVTVYL